MPKLTSVIVTAYPQTIYQAQMTMASIASVTKYTELSEYELILMSDSEKFPIRDDYQTLKIDRYEKTYGWGYTKSMNEGAKLVTGEYLVFLQNDVFVREGWLPDLRWYLENNKGECVIPDQMPRTREFVKKSYRMSYEEAMKFGSRDAGLLMITTEAFKRVGGWDERLSLLAEKDFYRRMAEVGIRQVDTCKTMITHIMAATNFYRYHTNYQEYDDMMKKDAEILNK
jgi:GT2 family glycosyltransferase